jgi:hypothetical protein
MMPAEVDEKGGVRQQGWKTSNRLHPIADIAVGDHDTYEECSTGRSPQNTHTEDGSSSRQVGIPRPGLVIDGNCSHPDIVPT